MSVCVWGGLVAAPKGRPKGLQNKLTTQRWWMSVQEGYSSRSTMFWLVGGGVCGGGGANVRGRGSWGVRGWCDTTAGGRHQKGSMQPPRAAAKSARTHDVERLSDERVCLWLHPRRHERCHVQARIVVELAQVGDRLVHDVAGHAVFWQMVFGQRVDVVAGAEDVHVAPRAGRFADGVNLERFTALQVCRHLFGGGVRACVCCAIARCPLDAH